MKRILCLLVAFMLVVACASAENALPNETYKKAREAVSLISYGEYDMALSRLGLTGEYTASQLKSYINKNCPEIYRGSVQTEVSVAWNDGECWQIAVPFEAPDDRAVGALVFKLKDSTHFESLSFARWGDVAETYSMYARVEWNKAYTPGYIIVGDW